MKYLLLKHKTTREPMVLIGAAPQTHAQLAALAEPAGFVPASAGFVRIIEGGKFETYGESASLRIGSHPDDSRIIAALHRATLAMNEATAPAFDLPVRQLSTIHP
jgi:hypothetical protein